MGASLTTLQTELRKMIGNPTTGEVADSILTIIINRSYRDFAQRYPKLITRPRANFNTVSGTATYSLPSPFTINDPIHVVWDRTNQVRLEKLGERRASERDSEGAASPVRGKPTAFAHWSDGLQLYPTPDGIYSIQVIGRRIVADLASGGDTTAISSIWDMAILLYSRWDYWSTQKIDLAKAQYALNEYTVWMAGKPLEVDEEKYAIDSGVEMPTLGGGRRGYDWDHED